MRNGTTKIPATSDDELQMTRSLTMSYENNKKNYGSMGSNLNKGNLPKDVAIRVSLV